MKTTSIMIVGVGGQGSLLASRLLGNLFVAAGHDVKVSEVHGMSQRGGSVVTYVRYGDAVYSPIIEEGEADFIVSFEELEALRYAKYLKKGGVIVTGEKRIDPMPVITGAAEYPADVISSLREKGITVDSMDASAAAKAVGSEKAENVVLMGLLSKHFDIPEESWIVAVEATVPAKFLDLNKAAFLAGREAPTGK